MIAYLSGYLAVKEPTHLVVECHGVGYLVRVSLNTYTAVRELTEALIYTHYQVKEDGHTLFGFFEAQERDAFELLLGVSGVGGSTALLLLSSLPPAELQQALARQDVGLIKRVKGIGQKTAERIVLELKDKVKGQFGPSAAVRTGSGSTPTHPLVPDARSEALQALATLGFPKAQVEPKVDALLAADTNLDAAALIKAVLRSG